MARSTMLRLNRKPAKINPSLWYVELLREDEVFYWLWCEEEQLEDTTTEILDWAELNHYKVVDEGSLAIP